MPSDKRSRTPILHPGPAGHAPPSQRGGGPTAASPTVSRWRVRLRSARHAKRVGTLLGHALRGGEVLALSGDLGTGKTTLVRGVAAGLGIPAHRITSPTFVLVQPHEGRLPLVHVDLYRLDTADQLRDLEWSDYLNGRWIVAVEWAERAASHLPHDHLAIHLEHHRPSTREAAFLANGPQAAGLLTRLVKAYEQEAAVPTRRRVRRTR